jgi:adenine-specific DNA-methyltransferase
LTKKTKLELTWPGKEERPKLEPRILIEHPAKSYHATFRRDGDQFGNLLIKGDNLLALKALEAQYEGAVKCIYIDPPFNTKQAFDHYEDGLEHSLWLSLMRQRIQYLHGLLSKDGSLFIHIDDNELGYLLVLTDEIFGRANRLGIITFTQSSASGPKAINPGMVTTNNYILYYAKEKSSWKPNRVSIPISRDDRYSKIISNINDPYGQWRIGNVRDAFQLEFGFSNWKQVKEHFGDSLDEALSDFAVNNSDRVVRTARVAPKDVTEEARVALVASAENRNTVFRAERVGKAPQFFLSGEQLIFYSSKVREIDGVKTTASPLTNLWNDILSNNLHAEGEVSFPNGKKPEALLKRCLELSTNRGDLVLDSFSGSGTTGAAAHKMGRRWIMVEIGDHADTHIVPRMCRVIDGTDQSGISKAVGWHGGGGFRYFSLAPSLLEKDRWGNWVIAHEYNPAMLAEAMCRHLGFTYAPSQDEGEYWRHGQSSETDFLYVTTQSLTYEALRLLSEEVGSERTLMVCAKAFSGNLDTFANLTCRKIPSTILTKCEWGRDDYSLNVSTLPEADADQPESAGPLFDVASEEHAGD